MLQLQMPPFLDAVTRNMSSDMVPPHPSFPAVYSKIKGWLKRFCFHEEEPVLHELFLFYLLSTKKYLDHRVSLHFFRLVLSIYMLQRQLQHSMAFSPYVRHLKTRWMPVDLFFPFSSKKVLGCLVGFNVMDRYELFDEENILLTLQKHLPQLRMVKESFYYHASQHKDLKIFYFEVEKRDDTFFTLAERKVLGIFLEEKIKNCIQLLSPAVVAGLNEEEVYKNILALSREIETAEDLPQAHITLDQQSSKGVVFRVILVYVTPYHRFSLKERFFDATFVSERILTVRSLDQRPIEAHIFCLTLPRDVSWLRSDGSLDFYSAREKVVGYLQAAVGDFRDYNGGILLKQQELFQAFKKHFPEEAMENSEFLATFFYTLMPLEKRVVLQQSTLCSLFSCFLQSRAKGLPEDAIYSFDLYQQASDCFLIVRSDHSSFTEVVSSVLQERAVDLQNIVYHFVDTPDGTFFNCAVLQAEEGSVEPLVQALQKVLSGWQRSKKSQQILRIGAEHLPYSLDPRIGGESVSADILRLLFEGLMRLDRNGSVENGVAQAVEISPNLKQYVFKLRSSFWNDGSPVTAHDFEYAWKKILSPHFKTAFATSFYHIKNAREAKEGKVPADQIGIEVIDDRTLKIDLLHPTPYFLQLITHPLYSPVHRLVDKNCPQWPYQCEENYPCNGPFQLKIHQPNQRYQFVRNPFYWNGEQTVIDKIIIKQMTPYQAFQAFQKNELDWVGNSLGSWHPSYIPGKEDKLLSFPNNWDYWCVFNTQSPFFHNQKLREAIALSIGRAEICANTILPVSPAYSLLAPRGNPSAPAFPERNYERARQLFTEALQELKIDKQQLSPVTLVFNQRGIREHTATVIKQQLKESLGLECQLVPLAYAQLFEHLSEGHFQMGLIHWTTRIDDPIHVLNAFRFAKEGVNFAKWEDAEFQRLLNLSDQEINPFQRSSYLLQAEKILSREMPVIPLFRQPSQVLLKKAWHICNPIAGSFDFAKSVKHKEEVYDCNFKNTEHSFHL